jgi:2,3,4,5-tetrahydropyridine-2-carboxylate N-succinyltransferase
MSINISELEAIISTAWDGRGELNSKTHGDIRTAVNATLDKLDKGEIRVAEKLGDQWQTHQWIKQAILLSFRLNESHAISGGPGGAHWYDKISSKMRDWDDVQFERAGFRAVPNCAVRHGAFIGKSVVLMPSFVNIGAYVDEGTMVDTWVTIGSCAQIGKNCHISGGVGIGGVLEPVQAAPVIIEDNVFVGARSEVAEGVIVETGAVLSMGVYLSASTKIIDRATGAVHYGRVPAYSVVVPGTIPGKDANSPGLYCAVIVKTVDEKTRSKTAINELLRD